MTISKSIDTQIYQRITRDVANFYERFPYPSYPLLARPHYVDAYLSSSHFSGTLASELTAYGCGVLNPLGQKNANHRIVVLGCGDSQPYVFKKWEPRRNKLCFVDLAAKNLTRARIRFGPYLRQVEWRHADLFEFLTTNLGAQNFSHIDAYGVLHHLARPSAALKLIADNLGPAGTLRLMVYNQAARDWILEIRKIFRLCKLDPYVAADRAIAKTLLLELAKLDSLKDVFSGLGKSVLKNQSRLCDTFFNQREINWLPVDWIKSLRKQGLQPLSLFDRYGELDDLENPMWHFPSDQELELRYLDKRFENNLEIIAVKQDFKQQRKLSEIKRSQAVVKESLLSPPKSWFTYLETKHCPRAIRRSVWRNFIHKIFNSTNPKQPLLYPDENYLKCYQRLARIGAVFPSEARKIQISAQLIAAMTGHMEPPLRAKQSQLPRSLKKLIHKVLDTKNLSDPRRFSIIERRILGINKNL